jgi:hypothetical protein
VGLLALTAAGCNLGAVVSPSAGVAEPAAAALPSILPPNIWQLTTVLSSVSGPDNCFTQRLKQWGLPRTVQYQMEVVRIGTGVSFEYDVRYRSEILSDSVKETGLMEARAFTAEFRSELISSCNGEAFSGPYVVRVTGLFADDDARITATELWRYEFPSGEVTAVVEWNAAPS